MLSGSQNKPEKGGRPSLRGPHFSQISFVLDNSGVQVNSGVSCVNSSGVSQVIITAVAFLKSTDGSGVKSTAQRSRRPWSHSAGSGTHKKSATLVRVFSLKLAARKSVVETSGSGCFLLMWGLWVEW